MILFHGTKSNFKEFSIPGNGKHGVGFYFTSSYSEAKSFAHTLSGNQERNTPRVITVNISTSNFFNTLNPEHCQQVTSYLGLEYLNPKEVGVYGNNEHYDYLAKILQKNGSSWDEVNKLIEFAGFDGIHYEFCDHYIIFSSDFINIEEIDIIDA